MWIKLLTMSPGKKLGILVTVGFLIALLLTGLIIYLKNKNTIADTERIGE